MVNLNYLYDKDSAKKHFNLDSFLNKTVGFRIIEHGTILPHKKWGMENRTNWVGFGGILNKQGKLVKESFHLHGMNGPYKPDKEIRKSSETVIYLGMFSDTWGHAITIDLANLWFLTSDTFKKEFKNCPLVYLPWHSHTAAGGYEPLDNCKSLKRLLEILEIDTDSLRPITEPTQFENIILPEGSFIALNKWPPVYTNEYRETIDRVRHFAHKNRTPTSNKKIYYFHGTRQFGEERLAEYFKSKGYEIVYPEKLTLDEQLNLLINTESFVSTLGSCSHNSVFLNEGTETIYIVRFANHFTGYQQVIDQAADLNANYVDSSLSLFGDVRKPILYIISRQLKELFGDKWDGYSEEDFKIFLQYIREANLKGYEVTPSAQEYYGSILADFMEQLKQHEKLIAASALPADWATLRPLLSYRTHVAHKGWQPWIIEGQISGLLDRQLDIQAIRINFPKHKVYYAVYYDEAEGWAEEVSTDQIAGTTGKSKAITGMKVRLDESGTKEFDILYRVHKFNSKWTSWAKNGETLYSHGSKLNAIQIKLEPKMNKPDASSV